MKMSGMGQCEKSGNPRAKSAFHPCADKFSQIADIID